MAARNSIDLRDFSTMNIWELDEDGDIKFVRKPNGIVFGGIAYMAPVNEPDTFLADIPEFNAHDMGWYAEKHIVAFS